MIWIKQDDRKPAASTALTRGTVIVDLTTASSITFKMKKINSTGALKVDSAAVILIAIDGTVEYQWAAGDTDDPGTFQAEWEVLWPDGTTETFPTIATDYVRINPDLDGSA